MEFSITRSAIVIALMVSGVTAFAGGDVPSKASNMGSIINTRHNLTQSFLGANAVIMDMARNNYGEVCVYCHTPHGANTTIHAPLWNRTVKPTSYLIYGNSGTLTQTVSQPGGSSLSCLSCHDGQTAIDSIINMPGSGRYNASQATTQNNTFLSTWSNPSNVQASHMSLGAPGQPTGCTMCHSATGTGASFQSAPSFDVFVIGTDLTNDHPVGITFPTTNGPGTGFNTPLQQGAMLYFDVNNNGAMDKGDVRLYGVGVGGAGTTTATVECASCHDPHGVPSAGPGSVFNPTFLRRSNNGSALCLTCHIK